MLKAIPALLLLTLHPDLAVAQPVPSQRWATLSVPAGTEALRCVAQLPADIPRAELLIDLTRRVALNTLEQTTWKRLAAYADWLDGFQERLIKAGATSSLDLRSIADKRLANLLEYSAIRLRELNGITTVEAINNKNDSLAFVRQCLGIDPEELAARLNAGEVVPVLPPADDLPSPLAANEWTPVLQQFAPARAFTSLIRDAAALRLYQALTSVEPDTARYLAAHASLLRELVADDRRVFATHASALRIRAGAVVVPGGDACSPAWRRIVGSAPQETEAFVRRVFTADEGRLAYFYAAIDALPPGRAAFAFADSTGKVSDEAAEQLYGTFRSALPAWTLTDRPMPLWFDPASALSEFGWNTDGRLKGPPSQEFWTEVFDHHLPEHAQTAVRNIGSGGVISAAWVIGKVFEDMNDARIRFEMFRFAQRVYGESNKEASADVFAGVTAFRRYPALMLGLERMGIKDPAVLASITRAAARLGDGTSEASMVMISQWQSAVALVEGMRRTGAIDAGVAVTWLTALASITPTGDGWFDGALARWLQTVVLPSVPLDGSSDQGLEASLLGLISAPVEAHGQAVDWEGLAYNVDITGAQTARARRIAQSQRRPRLDDVLALESAAEALMSANTMTDVSAASALLQSHLDAFKTPLSPAARVKDAKPVPGADYLAIALRDLARIKRDKDVPRARRVAAGLRRLCDHSLGRVITALLYAGRLGAAAGAPEQYADLWRRHDPGFRIKSQNATPAQWRPALNDSLDSRGGFLTGSIIGFDLALGRVLLRSVPGGRGGQRMPVPDPYVVPMLQMVALAASAPAQGQAVQLDTVVEALERGRRRWAEMRSSRWAEASALIGARRASLGLWLDAQDPSTAPHDDITASELVQLGRDERLNEATASDVGVPALLKDACWCARFPEEGVFRASVTERTLADAASDMYVRLAELLVRTRMPAAVLPSLIAAATSDLLERMAPTTPDDWRSLERAIVSVDTERQEQLLFALVSMRELETRGGAAGRW